MVRMSTLRGRHSSASSSTWAAETKLTKKLLLRTAEPPMSSSLKELL
jgi:hypothetical protein